MDIDRDKIIKFLKSEAINKSYFAKLAFPKNHVSIIHSRLNKRRGKLQDYHIEELRPHIIEFLNEFS